MALGQSMIMSVATDAVAVTPHDTNRNEFAYLYVGSSGDVTVKTLAGTTTTFTGVLGGSILWVQTSHVMATGTDATNIVGLR